MKKNKFKLKTKDIFLTYSKCPLGKDKIHNHIKELMASKKKKSHISFLIPKTIKTIKKFILMFYFN